MAGAQFPPLCSAKSLLETPAGGVGGSSMKWVEPFCVADVGFVFRHGAPATGPFGERSLPSLFHGDALGEIAGRAGTMVLLRRQFA